MLAACATVFAACGSRSTGPIDGERALKHAADILEFGPRPPGSEALRRAGDLVLARLRELGLEPQEQVWTEKVVVYDTPREVQFRNLWVEIPGRDPKRGPVLVIGAHLDSKLAEGHPDPAHNFPFVGAVDSAGACALLLELARHLKDRQADRPVNVWLVWFDGEECLEWDWVDEKALFGSRHFVATMRADRERFPAGLAARMRAMVLLDLVGAENLKIDRDVESSRVLLDIFADAAKELGVRERLYRWESPMKDDHIPFRRYGVSVIDLIDFRFRFKGDLPRQGEPAPPEGAYEVFWHTSDDTLERLSAESLKLAGDLLWAALPRIEQRVYGVNQR